MLGDSATSGFLKSQSLGQRDSEGSCVQILLSVLDGMNTLFKELTK